MLYMKTNILLIVFRSLLLRMRNDLDEVLEKIRTHILCVLVSMCIGVSVWLVGVVSV